MPPTSLPRSDLLGMALTPMGGLAVGLGLVLHLFPLWHGTQGHLRTQRTGLLLLALVMFSRYGEYSAALEARCFAHQRPQGQICSLAIVSAPTRAASARAASI
jgi:hypothetical protein